MAWKKASRKKASRKKTARVGNRGTGPRTNERPTEDEEKDTYIFCTHRMNEYVDPATTWRIFKGGKVKQLRFHTGGLGTYERKTEIEIFAARLDKYLLGLGYAGAEGARYSIRGAVEKPAAPMQGLLDTVAEMYIS